MFILNELHQGYYNVLQQRAARTQSVTRDSFAYLLCSPTRRTVLNV